MHSILEHIAEGRSAARKTPLTMDAKVEAVRAAVSAGCSELQVEEDVAESGSAARRISFACTRGFALSALASIPAAFGRLIDHAFARPASSNFPPSGSSALLALASSQCSSSRWVLAAPSSPPLSQFPLPGHWRWSSNSPPVPRLRLGFLPPT